MIRFLLAICLLLSLNGYSQKIRFTDTTNIWAIDQTNPDGASIPYHAHYGRDTVIGLTAYHTLHDGVVPAYIREDTVTNLVYAYNIYDSVDYVFYDYNLHVGDTFTQHLYSFTVKDSVVQVDSTLINGIYHKVFTLLSSAPRFYTVVEGIGCITSPMYPARDICFEGEKRLVCFRNSTGYPAAAFTAAGCWAYYYPYVNSAYCTNNIMPVSKHEFNISPNPATDNICVSGLTGDNDIYVYDLLGRGMLHTSTDQREMIITTYEWPRGIYYLVTGFGLSLRRQFILE